MTQICKIKREFEADALSRTKDLANKAKLISSLESDVRRYHELWKAESKKTKILESQICTFKAEQASKHSIEQIKKMHESKENALRKQIDVLKRKLSTKSDADISEHPKKQRLPISSSSSSLTVPTEINNMKHVTCNTNVPSFSSSSKQQQNHPAIVPTFTAPPYITNPSLLPTSSSSSTSSNITAATIPSSTTAMTTTILPSSPVLILPSTSSMNFTSNMPLKSNISNQNHLSNNNSNSCINNNSTLIQEGDFKNAPTTLVPAVVHQNGDTSMEDRDGKENHNKYDDYECEYHEFSSSGR